MKFYCLHEGLNHDLKNRIGILHQACLKKGVEFIAIDALDYDYSAVETLEAGSLYYKVGRGAQRLESILLSPSLITFFTQVPNLWFYTCTSQLGIIHEKIGLPQPKTIHQLTKDKTKLKKYVEWLEGFPVIVKITGGTKGAGVLKIDSFDSLMSIAEYLVENKQEAILREYIQTESSARLMVLGEKVIASMEYKNPPDDFRSNATSVLRPTNKVFPPNVEETAIKSVLSVGVEFGGVDIIFDDKGNHYLLEMNFPSGFQNIPSICNVEIGDLMIDYLIKKRELSYANTGSSGG